MRIFGDPTRMKSLMTRVGMKAGEAIESGMLTRQIERAQRRVEQYNFDARKQLLEYDDVANDQRRVIYQQRTDLMGTEDVSEAVVGAREDVVAQLVEQYLPQGVPQENWDLPELTQSIERDFGARLPIDEWVKADETGDIALLRNKIIEALAAAYETKRATVGAEIMRYIEKEVMLRTLDQHWREHLAAMDYMRQGIFLRSYAQKNPKQEYKREAFELFAGMLDRIKFDTVTTVSKVQVRSQAEIEREELERQQRLARALQLQHAEAVSPIQVGVVIEEPGGGDGGSGGGTAAVLEAISARGRLGGRAVRTAGPESGAQRDRVLAGRARSTSTATAPCSKRAAEESLERRRTACRAIHVAAAVLIDRRGRMLIAQRPAGKHLAGSLGISGRQESSRARPARPALARELEGRARSHDRASPAAAAFASRVSLLARCSSMFGWCGAIGVEPRGLDGQALRGADSGSCGARSYFLPIGRSWMPYCGCPKACGTRLLLAGTELRGFDGILAGPRRTPPDGRPGRPRGGSAALEGCLCRGVGEAEAAAAAGADFLVMRMPVAHAELQALLRARIVPVYVRGVLRSSAHGHTARPACINRVGLRRDRRAHRSSVVTNGICGRIYMFTVV